ncbi:peptidoglycan DD-metalloendopeptidase family protein [Streptomyces sp. NPDC059398]|uniref:peptidoglycan DD-metalloendopeptidase family protein n=1 Tax=Streptomyces sp. NPDC059398 TaxID=3346820 RepID=UPI00367E6F72
MNDQHTHAGYVGNDGYATGSPTGTFAVDPLFGELTDAYPPGRHEAPQAPQAGHSGEYDATQWDTGSHGTLGYDATYQPTGQWPLQPQPQAQAQSYGFPAQALAGHDTGSYDTTGQWDAAAWNSNAVAYTSKFENGQAATQQWLAQPDGYSNAGFGTADHDTTGYGPAGYGTGTGTGTYSTGPIANGAHGPDTDTGAHDATAWNSAGTAAPHAPTPTPHATQQFAAVDLADVTGPEHTAEFPAFAGHDGPGGFSEPELPHETGTEPRSTDPGTEPGSTGPGTGFGVGPGTGFGTEPSSVPVPGPLARRAPGGRGGRRRTPAKRSALLTIGVPSVCVMGVAGAAAATVGGIGEGNTDSGTATQAAADTSSVKPVAANSKLDGQLADLSHGADDFADRASRTQERIDLKERQATAKKKAEDEAARKEAARPKFVLPVTQKGLSAYFGQAGVNWMSVHTGIDFPVSYGTPVMAATDGTIRTQWNNAYGNMAMVTSSDGTETWYCHLSSTKIRSGSVKAGQVIAYSGSSGNSTGPHMHFEVRPHSGAAIDPLPWLRSHGLDPT